MLHVKIMAYFFNLGFSFNMSEVYVDVCRPPNSILIAVFSVSIFEMTLVFKILLLQTHLQ